MEIVTPEKLKRKLDRGEAVALDVRPADEFEAGHIKGAISIPLEEIGRRRDELPWDKEVVVYCRNSNCTLSGKAIAKLKAFGFVNVERLEGGYLEWTEASYPIEKSGTREGNAQIARVNNVDMEALEKTGKEFKEDLNKARKTQVIEGEWLLEEGGPQFRAQVSYEGGKVTLEADQPTNLGGGGKYPGPMHYCFYGLASCYTATFATMASQLGITLKKLATKVEAGVNLSRVFGLSDDPAMEEVRVTLFVESDAPEEKIKKAEELARQRCPVVYTLTNPVKLATKVEVAP